MIFDFLSVLKLSSVSLINFSVFQIIYTKYVFLYIYSGWIFFYGLLFRYSTLLYKVFFVDLNAFEVNKTLAFKTSLSTNLNILMYTFFSTKLGQKLVVLTHNTSSILTKTFNTLFQNITWAEREISEMFGISFSGKKDNRRLLLDFSFIGNPLLKSYPVTGFVEVYYDVIKQWIEYGLALLLEGEKQNAEFGN